CKSVYNCHIMTQTQPHKPKNRPQNQSGKKKPIKPKSFGSQLLSGLLIFMVLMLGYYLISDAFLVDKESFTLSELAEAVKKGEVSKLVVNSDEVTATFVVPEGADSNTEAIEKKTNKESRVSITATLSAFGVTPEMLSKANLEVQTPSNFKIILISLVPYILTL